MDHGNHGSGSDASAACKISMLWNWYTIDACFLSPSWHITSHGAFAATCIGVVLMVVLLEALRRLGREYDEHIQRDFAARVALIANGGVAVAGFPGSSSSSSAAGICPAVGGGGNAGNDSSGGGGGLAREALVPQTVTFRASPLQQLVRAAIHAATFGLAYIVMLLAMYYNGYIIISILVGALLGKFLCDWMTRTVVVAGPGLGGGVVAAKGPGNNSAAAGIEEPTVCCG